MSFFVRSTAAPKPKTKNIRPVSLLLAGIFIVMAVAQLFTFEDFPGVIIQMNLPGGEMFASPRAALIVILEIAALPFLLFMQLSPAARAFSMFAGWAVVIVWMATSLWTNIVVMATVNSGFLGATVSLASGWWMVLFSLALGTLAAWAAWGMWPLHQKHAK